MSYKRACSVLLLVILGVSLACGGGVSSPSAYFRTLLSNQTGAIGEYVFVNAQLGDIASTATWTIFADTDQDFSNGAVALKDGTGTNINTLVPTTSLTARMFYIGILVNDSSDTYEFYAPGTLTLSDTSVPVVTIVLPSAHVEYVVGESVPLQATVTNLTTFTWEVYTSWGTDTDDVQFRIGTYSGAATLNAIWSTTGLTPNSYYLGFFAKHGDVYAWKFTPFLITLTIHDHWQTMSNVDAPEARYDAGSVWSGSEYIVWGGHGATTILTTGGAYNPWLDEWRTISNTNAPSPRTDFATVWCGDRMIVWGGYGSGTYLNTGAMYYPDDDLWVATPTDSAPTGRKDASVLWTTGLMIVWGGEGTTGMVNTGAVFSPTTGIWAALPTTNAPSPRRNASMVWTGTELVVWGGSDSSGVLRTGGVWNFSTNLWRSITLTNAPSAREEAFAIWSATRGMILFGGNSTEPMRDGGIYNPGTDVWTAIPITAGSPDPYGDRSIAFNGEQLIVWGGYYLGYSGDGAVLDIDTGVWTAMTTTDAPSARSKAATSFTGSVMMVWGGSGGVGPQNGGAYYFP